MDSRRVLKVAASVTLCAGAALPATPQTFHLDTAQGFTLLNVQAEAARFGGKRGLRVTLSDEAGKRLQADPKAPLETLAVIDGTDFSDGVIEVEIAGAPVAGAPEGARGFVGIAFRVRPDQRTYDAFYLRPTNGRSDDQLRRNHAAQYVSHPDWPWYRLREETPGRYESYVDIEPGRWIRMRIEVHGERARLFVNGQSQPTLVVNDLKTGAQGRGAIALWIDNSTVAHFRDLRISRD